MKPQASPTAALATQTECYQWSATHIKNHSQCAKQVKSPCSLTKCYACHWKMNVTSDLPHISNVISNVRSKQRQLATSLNISPKVINDLHHMQPHFHCAEQAKAPCNLTKYCACHAKCKNINDLLQICNPIPNALDTQRHPATSPNTAPATQNASHQWSAFYMQAHFQCVEAVKSPSNLPNTAPTRRLPKYFHQ